MRIRRYWLIPLIALVITFIAAPITLAWLGVSNFIVDLLITLELSGFLPLTIILLALQKMSWDTIEFTIAYDLWLTTKLHATELRKEVEGEKTIDDLALVSRAMLLSMIDRKKAVINPDAPIKVLIRHEQQR